MVLIGEMRDQETLGAALAAAESNHLYGDDPLVECGQRHRVDSGTVPGGCPALDPRFIGVYPSCEHSLKLLWSGGRAPDGMVDLTESLRRLVARAMISVKTTDAAAPNFDELQMQLEGISVTGGGIIG